MEREPSRQEKLRTTRTARQARFYERVAGNLKNCPFEDVCRLLEAYGYETKAQGSSHYTFRQPGRTPFTVPRARPVKAIWVRLALEIIDEIENEQLLKLDIKKTSRQGKELK